MGAGEAIGGGWKEWGFGGYYREWSMSSICVIEALFRFRLVHAKTKKIIKISRHIESCGTVYL